MAIFAGGSVHRPFSSESVEYGMASPSILNFDYFDKAQITVVFSHITTLTRMHASQDGDEVTRNG